MGGMDQIGGTQFNVSQALFNSTPELGAPTFITPDSLLAYCSTRLRNLDESMQKQFQTQQQGIQDSQQLNKVEQMLKDKWQTMVDDKGNLGGDVNLNDGTSFVNDTEAEIAKIQDPSARKTAQEALGSLSQMKKGADFQAFKTTSLDPLDSGKQALSQGAELGMIGLQSLMSQRQTAVQMTTNLVQAFGESLKSVAGNVGK